MKLPDPFREVGGLKADRVFFASGEIVSAVTLLGEGQAVVGSEFVYGGPQPECGPCKVRAVCLNQELGRRYRVTAVRDVTHRCLLNEERARVVEVEPAPPTCSLPVRGAVEGAVIRYDGVVCSNGRCANYRTCHPVGLKHGVRVKVLEAGGELDCPLGYELVSARVAYAR